MKEVYVKELPKNCRECIFRNLDLCCITDDYIMFEKCPLKSLEEHDKELERQIAILEKALELAVENSNYWFKSEKTKKLNLKDYSANEFLEQAKEILEND